MGVRMGAPREVERREDGSRADTMRMPLARTGPLFKEAEALKLALMSGDLSFPLPSCGRWGSKLFSCSSPAAVRTTGKTYRPRRPTRSWTPVAWPWRP